MASPSTWLGPSPSAPSSDVGSPSASAGTGQPIGSPGKGVEGPAKGKEEEKGKGKDKGKGPYKGTGSWGSGKKGGLPRYGTGQSIGYQDLGYGLWWF